MLDIARRRLPSVELVCAVVPPLPFEDDAFELLFTSHFYRHVVSPEERRRFLSEAFRVAREVVVVEQTRRPGFPDEVWEEHELRDGSRHRVFKGYFTADRLQAELDGELELETRSFLAVRASRASERARARAPSP